VSLEHRDKLLDLYIRFDNWLDKGRFDLIDDEMRNVVIDDFDPEIIVGYLAAASCAADKLEAYKPYLERAALVLSDKIGLNRTYKVLAPYLRL
jgi:hypothetical protein